MISKVNITVRKLTVDETSDYHNQQLYLLVSKIGNRKFILKLVSWSVLLKRMPDLQEMNNNATLNMAV